MTLLGRNQNKRYLVHFTQHVFEEENTKTTCRNYPNKDFASYVECDDLFVRRAIEKKAPGLIPIWATEHLENVISDLLLCIASERRTVGDKWLCSDNCLFVEITSFRNFLDIIVENVLLLMVTMTAF